MGKRDRKKKDGKKKKGGALQGALLYGGNRAAAQGSSPRGTERGGLQGDGGKRSGAEQGAPQGACGKRAKAKHRAAADLAGSPKPSKPAKSAKLSKPPKSPKPPKQKKAALPLVQGATPNGNGRSESPCPVAHKCGACQHIAEPYAQQLAAKDARMAELFAGIAALQVIKPIMGMDDPFHYRNKVVSPFAPGRKLGRAPGGRDAAGGARDGRDLHGKGSQRAGGRRGGLEREVLTGMYAAHSHRIIPTDGCLVENQQAKQVIAAIRDLMARYGIEPYREDAGTGFMRHAVVRVGHTSGEMLVTLVTNGREFPASRSFCRALRDRCPGITTIVQNVNTRMTNVILGQEEHTLYGPGFILDTLCGLSFRISSQSFYQVNAVQTEVLYREAIRLAQLTGAEAAIDAYCGTGTIGLVAAKNGAAQVIGVESVSSAVRDARQNARHNSVGNAEFVTADAADLLRALAGGGGGAQAQEAAARLGGFDPSRTVLFMDPPRAGSSEEFLSAAAVLMPARIVYISCKPETQVRDIAVLQGHGYKVRAVQPVDMFPHTDHIESIAMLER